MRATTEVDELLVGVAGGDGGAFTRFYTLTAPRVLALSPRLLVDQAAAEDAAQDTYLEAWTKAAAFDPARGSALTWLLQIAHHRAVDRVRTAESQRRRDSTYALQTASPAPESAHRLLRACEVSEVHAAIHRLSPRGRQALTYAYFTDHTSQQASELLGIPVGTHKSRVRDAVLAVRNFLAAADAA